MHYIFIISTLIIQSLLSVEFSRIQNPLSDKQHFCGLARVPLFRERSGKRGVWRLWEPAEGWTLASSEVLACDLLGIQITSWWLNWTCFKASCAAAPLHVSDIMAGYTVCCTVWWTMPGQWQMRSRRWSKLWNAARGSECTEDWQKDWWNNVPIKSGWTSATPLSGDSGISHQS